MKSIMKKFLLVAVVSLLATGAYAQNWKAGLRLGSSVQAVAMYDYSSECYLEGRAGLGYISGLTADISVLNNWKVAEMNWTPSAGIWNFDAGVGVNAGFGPHWIYAGVAGMARLSFTFAKAPITLGIDWTPSLGPVIADNTVRFGLIGFYNGGLTVTYNF